MKAEETKNNKYPLASPHRWLSTRDRQAGSLKCTRADIRQGPLVHLKGLLSCYNMLTEHYLIRSLLLHPRYRTAASVGVGAAQRHITLSAKPEKAAVLCYISGKVFNMSRSII